MADNKVTVEFEVVSNAAKKLDEIGKSLESLQDTADGGFKKASSSFKVFEGVLTAELALRAIDGLINAASKLFDVFVVEGVKAALETEAAINKLSFALAQSGNFSEEAVASFAAYAEEIQRTTTVSNDAALATGALIAQISGLGGTQLEQATSAAIDLSAALGIDLETAARKVALATQGQTEALNRYGIRVVKASDESEQFANVLQALEKVQGAGANRAKTFEGAVAQLQNQFSDITKIFGEAIVKNQAIINVFNEATKILGEFQASVGGNEKGLKSLVAGGLVATIDGLIKLVSALGATAAAFEALKGILLAPFTALSAAIAASALALGGQFKAALEALKAPGRELAEALRGAGSAEIFNGAIDALGRLRISAEAGAEAIATGQDKVGSRIKNNTENIKTLSKALEELALKAVKASEEFFAKLDPQDSLDKQLAAVKAALEARRITEQEAASAIFFLEDQKAERIKENNARLTEELLAETQRLIDEESFRRDGANEERIASNQATLDRILANEQLTAKSQESLRAFNLAQEKRLDAERRQVIGNFVAFQQSKIGAVAAIGKAAAVYQTTIATKEAAVQAYKSLVGIPLVGPVLAPVAAGAAIAFGAEQIAGILGAQLASGIDSVPGIGTKDNFPAVLAPGERVVPTRTNQDLTAFLQDQGGQGVLLQAIVDRLDRLQNQIIVNVGGRESVNELRDASLSGRTIEAA